MELVIITILAVVVAYAVFVVVFPKAIPDESDKHTQKVLQQVYQDTKESEDTSTNIAASLEDESAFVRQFFALPLINSLYPLILKAGLREKTEMVALIYISLAFVLAVLLTQILGIAGLAAGPAFGYLLISFYLKRKIKKRNEAFINTFPDVLDMFVRSLKSGFPVTTAFRTIAENMEPPVSTEFQRVVQELAMGQSVAASLTRLAERIDEQDIHFFVVVMKVQQETGGNLAEVITNLANVIRKRKQLRLKIKAMTSEGRATALILGSLPVIIFAALSIISPGYLNILWTDTIGMIWLGIAIGLVASCMFIVNKMVSIDI